MMKTKYGFRDIAAAPFRFVWKIISAIWPARTATFASGGNITFAEQTTFSRFFKASVKAVLVLWALWSTYVFVYHRPILQQRTAELEQAKARAAQQFSDLVEYHKRFTELHKEMNVIDDQILNTKKLDASVADELLKKRLTTWAQMDLIQTKLNGIFESGNYKPEATKLSEIQITKQLTDEENRQLKLRNAELESAMLAVSKADAELIERVEQLATSEIASLEGYMRKISGSLTALGLNQKAVVTRAKSSDEDWIGDKISKIIAPESDKINPKYGEVSEKVELWQGLDRARTMLPVGNPIKNPYLTSKFGDRTDPFGSGKPSIHKGVDFAGQIGTPLYSVSHGRVTKAGVRSGYGNTVEIDHGLGFSTLYAHLSEIRVKVGDYVEAKSVIGLGGNSGRSTGPHLHYEIRYKGAPFNPYTFIEARKLEY